MLLIRYIRKPYNLSKTTMRHAQKSRKKLTYKASFGICFLCLNFAQAEHKNQVSGGNGSLISAAFCRNNFMSGSRSLAT